MRLGKVLIVIAALALCGPHCLMWAASPKASSSMQCHDTEKPAQHHDMAPCCEDQGISVSTFHTQPEALPMAMTASVILFAETYTVTADLFVRIDPPRESGKRLAELSLLRI